MVSIETQARLAKLLLNLADGEKAVEVTRQVLGEQLDFDCYKAFKRIDRESKNYIDSYNIVDFLKLNSVYCSINEARGIISFYDADSDGNISYSEFINLVLSENDYSLRRTARNNIGYTSYRDSNILSYDVEYSLSKVFERELENIRNITILLEDLKSRYDYNVLDLFTTIQTYGLDTINGDDLRKFFVRNEADYLESDIRSISKRLDTDSDGRTAIYEFRKFLNINSVGSIDTKTNFVGSTSINNISRSRTNFSQTKSSRGFGSPLRDSMRSLSPRRVGSPILNSSNRFSSPNRSTLSKSVTRYTSPLRDSLNKSVSKLSSSPRNNLSVLSRSNGFSTKYSSYEEETFLNFIKELLSEERKIERVKTELSLKSDFNIEDLFRVFELDGRGYLTESDIKYGINAFDLYPGTAEVNLLLKRFDNNEGVLSFGSFFDMVSPQSREYRRILENRLPNTQYSLSMRGDIFLQSTKYLIKELLEILLKSETNIEAIRQRLNKLPRFSIRAAFEKIYRLDKSYVSEADIIDYLKRNDINYLSSEVDLVLNRLDKNGKGRVSYSDFYDEVNPKSRELFI